MEGREEMRKPVEMMIDRRKEEKKVLPHNHERQTAR